MNRYERVLSCGCVCKETHSWCATGAHVCAGLLTGKPYTTNLRRAGLAKQRPGCYWHSCCFSKYRTGDDTCSSYTFLRKLRSRFRLVSFKLYLANGQEPGMSRKWNGLCRAGPPGLRRSLSPIAFKWPMAGWQPNGSYFKPRIYEICLFFS
jgi:hypothetical protein